MCVGLCVVWVSKGFEMGLEISNIDILHEDDSLDECKSGVQVDRELSGDRFRG